MKLKQKAMCMVSAAALMGGVAAEAGIKFDVMRNRIERVKQTLAANPNALKEADAQQITYLHTACQKNHIDMVKLLIDNGAEVSLVQSQTGSTPLHMAARYGSGETVQLLVEAGANPNVADKNKATPLHQAAVANNHKAVKYLLDLRDAQGKPIVNIDAVDSTLFPPLLTTLHEYKIHKGQETALLLIEAGANLDLHADGGKYPIHKAAWVDFDLIIKALLAKGVDVNLKSGAKDTPLMLAVKNGAAKAVKVLLENGAVIDEWIMKAAESRTNTEIIELLKKHGK